MFHSGCLIGVCMFVSMSDIFEKEEPTDLE